MAHNRQSGRIMGLCDGVSVYLFEFKALFHCSQQPILTLSLAQPTKLFSVCMMKDSSFFKFHCAVSLLFTQVLH